MDILAGLRLQVSGNNNPLREKTFEFLVCMMGCRDQLRMNHWQTTSYAEHKMTDDLMGTLDDLIDKLGEATLGQFGRPQITTLTNNVSDINIVSSKSVIAKLEEGAREMLAEYKVTECEGIVNLLGELDTEIQKFKYLSTLE
jgi:hypothetical protein